MATDKRPTKPYPKFPLFPHASGQWAKKIDGSTVYFGKWVWPNREDYERSWKAALDAYNRRLEDQAHGRLLTARPERMTIKQLVDAYLTHQHGRATGRGAEIKARTFSELRRRVTQFRDFVGRNATIADLEYFDPLRPGDSAVMQYIEATSRRYGWHAFNGCMGAVSGMWTWAEHPICGVLRRPFRLKSLFQKREELLKRREKRRREEQRGKQLWTPDELGAFFRYARQPLRTMLELMYFCCFGNSDCADLYDGAINWEPDLALGLPDGWGVIHFPRPKTEIERACVVPAFVMEDLAAARAARPRPAAKEWAHRVLLTQRGFPWVRDAVHEDPDQPGIIHHTTTTDSLSQEFVKLRSSLGRCERHGWFSSLQDRPGKGHRSDLRGERRVHRARVLPPAKCPRCGGPLRPMRKLGPYTFKHTSITVASGAADIDTLALFEGHAIEGVRREYVEDVEVHRLRPVAEKLLLRLNLPVTRSSGSSSVSGAAAANAAAERPVLSDDAAAA